MNWEALGKGASFTVPMVVDNTAPELLDVSLSLMGGNLTVQAKDNQYVAGVVLYNASGAKIFGQNRGQAGHSARAKRHSIPWI